MKDNLKKLGASLAISVATLLSACDEPTTTNQKQIAPSANKSVPSLQQMQDTIPQKIDSATEIVGEKMDEASQTLKGAAENASKAMIAGGVMCLGINECKGNSECATVANACKGQNNCRSQGIIKADSADDCLDKGGVVQPG